METLRTFGRGDLNRLHGAVLRIVLDVGRVNKRLPTPFITLLGDSDTRPWLGRDVRDGQIVHGIDQAKRDLILSSLVGCVLRRLGDSVPGSLVSYLEERITWRICGLLDRLRASWVWGDLASSLVFLDVKIRNRHHPLGPRQKIFQLDNGRERVESHDGSTLPSCPKLSSDSDALHLRNTPAVQIHYIGEETDP
jgi:hypothetical protein